MPENTDMSQWTLATLREYILAIIQTNDSRYSERFESSQTALQAALTAQLLSKIGGGSAQDFRIVFYLANQEVTFLAQKGANLASSMTMIDCQTLDVSSPAIPVPFRSIAQGAYPMLTCKHRVILLYGQVELLAELANSVDTMRVFLRMCPLFCRVRFSIDFIARLAGTLDTKAIPSAAIRGKGTQELCFMASRTLFGLIWRCYCLFVPSVLRVAHLAPGLLFIGVLSVSSKVSKGLCVETSIALFLRYTVHDKGHSLSGPGYYKYRGVSSCLPYYSINRPGKQVYEYLERV